MAIIKLSYSKKSVQFVDEQGNVFFTSVNFLLGLLNGKSPHGFIQMKRLPIPIAMGRFKPSELWDPEGLIDKRTLEPLKNANDGFSKKSIEQNKDVENIKDKVVW